MKINEIAKNSRTYTKKSGYVTDLETATERNKYFRKVLYTTENSQLVLMCLRPTEDIGTEIHRNGDQFIRIEQGNGTSTLNGKTFQLKSGDCVVVTKGTEHNVTNTSTTDMLYLYVVYSPPQHKLGTVDKLKPSKH